MNEWFKAAPCSSMRGKAGTQLPSDVHPLEWGSEVYVGDSNQTDRDKLANNR